MKEITIYDAYDRPIKKQDLTREYAAPTLTGVRTLWNEGVASGLTPQRLAGILKAADDGDMISYLTLAEEMEEREPHYASVLGTRKRAVKRLPVVVESAGDDQASITIADAVRAMAKRPGFKSMEEDCLDGLGKGFSCVEIIWDRSGARWQPDFQWRDPRFFTFDRVRRNQIRLLDESDLYHGIELPPYKFITHLPKLKSGIPIRGGLARLVAWSYMAKMFTFKDWLAFMEVFGMPLRVGRYGASATERDIDILKTAVANLGSDAAAVLPDSMKIDFVEAAKSTGGDKLFLGLAEWIDKQISKAVLGQTMTSDDGSSQAQAKVHDEVRGDIRDADAEQLEETLNRDLVRPFVDLNFGPQATYPTLQLQITEPEDIKALADSLAKLVPLGLRVEQSVVRDKLGLPDPDKNAKPEDLLVAQGSGLRAQDTAQNHERHSCPHCSTALNASSPAPRTPSPEPDAADHIASRLATEAAPAMDAMIDTVRQLVLTGESLPAIRDRLFELFSEMDSASMGEVMSRALTTANLAGRAEVTDGN